MSGRYFFISYNGCIIILIFNLFILKNLEIEEVEAIVSEIEKEKEAEAEKKKKPSTSTSQ